jgi:hypothetical protein
VLKNYRLEVRDVRIHDGLSEQLFHGRAHVVVVEQVVDLAERINEWDRDLEVLVGGSAHRVDRLEGVQTSPLVRADLLLLKWKIESDIDIGLVKVKY